MTKLLATTLMAGTMICGAMIVLPTAALAQEHEAPRDYNIPAGSLTDALNQIAEQSGLQLNYEAALTEGRTSRGLRGRFTRREALSLILADTGLAARDTGTASVTIAPATMGRLDLDALQVRGAAVSSEQEREAELARQRTLGARATVDDIVVIGEFQNSLINRLPVDPIKLPFSLDICGDRLAAEGHGLECMELDLGNTDGSPHACAYTDLLLGTSACGSAKAESRRTTGRYPARSSCGSIVGLGSMLCREVRVQVGLKLGRLGEGSADPDDQWRRRPGRTRRPWLTLPVQRRRRLASPARSCTSLISGIAARRLWGFSFQSR